jgi:hypothetical protein
VPTDTDPTGAPAGRAIANIRPAPPSSGLVAAGTPPMLVSEALAIAAEAVHRGIEANAAEILDALRAQERTD